MGCQSYSVADWDTMSILFRSGCRMCHASLELWQWHTTVFQCSHGDRHCDGQQAIAPDSELRSEGVTNTPSPNPSPLPSPTRPFLYPASRNAHTISHLVWLDQETKTNNEAVREALQSPRRHHATFTHGQSNVSKCMLWREVSPTGCWRFARQGLVA